MIRQISLHSDHCKHEKIKYDIGACHQCAVNTLVFLQNEVDELYRRYLKLESNPRIALEDLGKWYDGYHTFAGDRVYNPRSMVVALTNNNLGNYWTSAGPYDEIFYYIKNNVNGVKDDLARMITGDKVRSCAPVKLYQGFGINH